MYKITKNYENVNKALFFSQNKFGIPQIEPTQITCNNFIGFNEAKSSKKTDSGVHFFLDDYQFERCWNSPDRYIEVLKRYRCVLSPDFSLFTEFPKACRCIIIIENTGLVHIGKCTV